MARSRGERLEALCDWGEQVVYTSWARTCCFGYAHEPISLQYREGTPRLNETTGLPESALMIRDESLKPGG